MNNDYGITINTDNLKFDADTITVDGNWYDTEPFIYNPPASGKLTLSGNDADIVIDGVSLKETLKGLNDRLAILQVNPALEAEFDELHALGEQYRALERKLLEKKAVWDALNKNGN